MELNLTEQEFIQLYKTQPYRVIKEKTGLYDSQIAELAKRLGLSKPKGRPKNKIEFKKEVG